MAKKKKAEEHAGGHGWFVTFADLMGLLMSFFVMLVSYSTQDTQKLKIVAGSMRDAFGVQSDARYSGVIESDGLPTRGQTKNKAHVPTDEASNVTSPDETASGRPAGAKLKMDREFALASASLRQALQDMPEITEISKNIMFEETKLGLNLEIIDQNGRSMFADGSKFPMSAPDLASEARGSAEGNPAARRHCRAYGGWLCSVARRIRCLRPVCGSRQRGSPDLEREGLPSAHVFSVSRKGRQPAAVSRRSVDGGQSPA